jgi:integrase
MKGTIRATVKYGGFPQKEKRFVAGTPKRIIKSWKARTLALMMKRSPQPERTAKTGTLAQDAVRYYPLVKHLTSWRSRRGSIRAWLPLLGERLRHTITREDILRVRGEWCAKGVAPKTINNRLSALRDLYRKLDGDDAPTPCDGIKPLTSVKVPPQIVPPELVNRVLATLEARAEPTYRKGRPCKYALRDRAWLMVLASTGKRPVEVERAQPADVDLRRRVWVARDAKGGFSPGCYLNDEMIAAWEAFVAADAWGKRPDHFERRLRDAGWPAGVKPYNLRHSTWIEASERGIDLADIQAGAGHRRIETTRRHYVPVLNSRMQKMSERLEGRFGWQPRLAPLENITKTG